MAGMAEQQAETGPKLSRRGFLAMLGGVGAGFTAVALGANMTPSVSPSLAAIRAVVGGTPTVDQLVQARVGGESFLYTVREGQSLQDIIDYFGLSLENLRRLNSDLGPSLSVQAGRSISIPAGGEVFVSGRRGAIEINWEILRQMVSEKTALVDLPLNWDKISWIDSRNGQMPAKLNDYCLPYIEGVREVRTDTKAEWSSADWNKTSENGWTVETKTAEPMPFVTFFSDEAFLVDKASGDLLILTPNPKTDSYTIQRRVKSGEYVLKESYREADGTKWTKVEISGFRVKGFHTEVQKRKGLVPLPQKTKGNRV